MTFITACLAILLLVRINTLLVYFQQEEYHSYRFAKAVSRIPLIDVIASVSFVVTALVAYLVPREGSLACVVAGIAMIGIAIREARYSYKKRSSATERLRRVRLLAIALMTPALALPWIYFPLGLITLQLPPLAIVMANRLLRPVQRRIDQRFVGQASDKLEHYCGTRIAVTGSFGKTTVKHLLGELLNVAGPTHYSRGSVNTLLGLTRHIRQRLQTGHQFLIAEMGAYGQGSIRRLCQFVRPTIGIITAIGDAHTERFGSREAVGRAKGELAQWVISHGNMMVIADQVVAFEPVKSMLAEHREKFLVCGTSQDCDVAYETRLEGSARSVSLTIRPLANLQLTCQIASLGEYEAMNLALAVGAIVVVAPSLVEQLPFLVPNVGQVAHRLEKKEVPGHALILDDAYNSNEMGFQGAVDVARQLAKSRRGRVILITPGIVELGDEHDPVHARLGTFCARKCDVAIVINPDRIEAFSASFMAVPDHGTLLKAESLSEARHMLSSLSPSEADVVLYENDLPDLHEVSRLL